MLGHSSGSSEGRCPFPEVTMSSSPSELASFAGRRRVPTPVNEPVVSYAPGTPQRTSLKARLAAMAGERIEIPLIIGGKDVRTGKLGQSVMPHDHAHVLADYHKASEEHIVAAIEAARAAHAEWSAWPWEDRAAVMLKAAELLTTTWRDTVNAATMLGQSKTAHQAEIDAAAEIIDFWRFNVQYAQDLYDEQPVSDHTMWNQVEYRPLEGFVYAITPFNFTSIAANLPTAPALMGNTVVWKPASSAMLSAYYLMRLMQEAGFPPGVINFVAGDSSMISNTLLSHRDLAGVHFTGSTEVFNSMWKTIGANMSTYRSYPRIVGETGGKDFIIAHPSADRQALVTAIARGGFEYQGQKCSAVSRVYIPRSIWTAIRDQLAATIDGLEMGDIRDFRNFMGAVIDKKAFASITSYIDDAKEHARILAGGTYDASKGYFIRPTLVEAPEPGYRLLCEEIFGPVVTAWVYEDDTWADTLQTVNRTSPYALTGAVFAQDRQAVREARSALRQAAGNFYINDKPTGAVVGQQPFGGARASGTNDKAGSKLNLVRWVSARAIKENFSPPREVPYPFMGDE
jgi:1-pyrroline-5-carboxylate dehydrogenase